MSSRKPMSTVISETLSACFKATGIPDMAADIRAHTKEVRREQENFQRQLQWTADTKGLKALEDQHKAEKAARRKALWDSLRIR